MADVGEIEHMPSTSVVGTKDPDYDPDDIHQAALVDNPDKPEKLSWTTYAAIGVCSSPGYFISASTLPSFWLSSSAIALHLILHEGNGRKLTDHQSPSSSWVSPPSHPSHVVTSSSPLS